MAAADPGADGELDRAQPGGLEHGLGSGHGAAGRRPRAGPDWACSRSTRRGCRESRRRCSPRTYLLSNLFRDQLDRYGELETLADRWAELVAAEAAAGRRPARPERRRPADGRPRPRPRRRRVLRRRRRFPGAARAPARRRLQALPQLRAPVRLRRRLSRPHRPVPLPELRPGAPRAAGVGPGRRARGHDGRPVRARDPAGRRADAPPPPRSTTSTTPSARRRSRSSSGLAGRPSARRSRASAGRSGASRRSRCDGDTAGVDPAREEPGRGQRGAAHADARGRARSTSGSA